MTESKICTCPSGDGSLRHPCPAHPASVELAGVAANLTFINGRPAMCGCQVEYSSGGGEYSDVIYVTLCAKHSGSAILDLVATNRIALTPEYEGQWHADLYLDREIPLAKAEGATPAEAVLALMSAERIDPEQESVEQAGGDERDLQGAQGERDGWGPLPIVQVPWNVFDRAVMWVEDRRRYGDDGTIVDDWKALKTIQRAALAQPSPVRSSLLINGYQLRAALDFIAPDGTAEQLKSEACIEWRQQDADFLEAGLYAFCAEYPEEGGVLLDEEPTTAQPSPLQSEQAEAERPEVVAYFDRNYPSTGDAFIWSNYEGSPYEPVMTVSQHERIVGALRSEIAEWQEAAGRSRSDVVAYIAERAKLLEERDAAQARVAGLEAELETERMRLAACGTAALGYFDGCADAYKSASLSDVLRLRGDCDAALARVAEFEAQAQHSMPGEFIGRLSEFLAQRGATGKALLRELRTMLAAAPGKEGV